jgi:hypothetical protein
MNIKETLQALADGHCIRLEGSPHTILKLDPEKNSLLLWLSGSRTWDSLTSYPIRPGKIIDDPSLPPLNFTEALLALKDGKCVQSLEWEQDFLARGENGQVMYHAVSVNRGPEPARILWYLDLKFRVYRR